MCPICIGAAALATMAGSGSAGGLAAFVAVKLHMKRHEDDGVLPNARKSAPQTGKTGDGK
jgi:hypothetical protein